MDKDKLKILATEAMPHVEIERLKIERVKLEAIPEPEKKASVFEGAIKEMEKALQAELNQVCANIVQTSNQNIASAYNENDLLKQAQTLYRKEAMKLAPPYLMLQALPLFKQNLEHAAYSYDVGQWSNRFNDIDGKIQSWLAKIPEPFSPEKINIITVEKMIPGNKHLRWPVDRCKQVDGKWADSWLTDFLHSKPILFDSPQYKEKLIEFYKTVYLGEAQKDEKAATQQAIEEEKAIERAKQEQPYQECETTIPAQEMQLFYEDGLLRNPKPELKVRR